MPESIYHSCCITESPLCIGAVESDEENDQELKVIVMFEKQPASPLSIKKHFETDEVDESTKEEPSIEEYLKAIKHEQILSQ